MAKRRILILCTGNSARSQMAEGIFRHLAGDSFAVESAGTNPVGVNPLAVEAMREIGIDIGQQSSKSVSRFEGQSFDLVITVCDNAAEHCPVFPGAPERLHWSLPDPAAVPGDHAQKMAAFRAVRDQLLDRARSFLK